MAKVEGLTSCDWVLIDAGDVIVHIFRPEIRGFYNLRRCGARIVRWNLAGPEPFSFLFRRKCPLKGVSACETCPCRHWPPEIWP